MTESKSLLPDSPLLFALGSAAYAYSSGPNYSKRIMRPRAQLRDSLNHSRWLSLTRAAIKPDQNHSGRRPAARIHQFAKVPILREEYALLIQSALQNLFVCRAPRDFGNRHYIMACLAQRLDHWPSAAFVG
jgi:hypothetical protein